MEHRCDQGEGGDDLAARKNILSAYLMETPPLVIEFVVIIASE